MHSCVVHYFAVSSCLRSKLYIVKTIALLSRTRCISQTQKKRLYSVFDVSLTWRCLRSVPRVRAPGAEQFAVVGVHELVAPPAVTSSELSLLDQFVEVQLRLQQSEQSSHLYTYSSSHHHQHQRWSGNQFQASRKRATIELAATMSWDDQLMATGRVKPLTTDKNRRCLIWTSFIHHWW